LEDSGKEDTGKDNKGKSWTCVEEKDYKKWQKTTLEIHV
jgi:hypothetical protein